MIKHTQTNRRQQATNYLSVFDHFLLEQQVFLQNILVKVA